MSTITTKTALESRETVWASYLDTPTTASWALDLANAADLSPGVGVQAAQEAIRGVQISDLRRRIDLWAERNRFTVQKVAVLPAGITVIIDSTEAPAFLEEAVHPFDGLLAPFQLDPGYVTIEEQNTGNDIDY